MIELAGLLSFIFWGIAVRRHLELAESHYGNIKGLKEEGVNK